MIDAMVPVGKRHSASLVSPSAKIGRNVTIGPWSVIGPTAVIGDDCVIIGATVGGTIGDRCKVWRGAHVMFDAVLGDDCQVCNNAIVLSNAKVGNRVEIQLSVGLGRYAIVEDDVFIGPGVIFCNSKNPRLVTSHEDLDTITIRSGAMIGANVCLVGAVTIGRNAIVGAGAVVTKDVPDGGVALGRS